MVDLATVRSFIDTLDDLRKRSVFTATEYDTVQAAGLMRRLILDQDKLMHQANRDVAMKITFHWYPVHWMGAGRFVIAAPHLDPTLGSVDRLGDSIEMRSGKVDNLLAWGVLRYGGHQESLKAGRLISYYANRLGGVHSDNRHRPNDPQILVEALSEIPEQVHPLVGALARVVVAGLEPLAAHLYFNNFVIGE